MATKKTDGNSPAAPQDPHERDPGLEQVLRESEARHRFLATLAAATQPLTDPSEVMLTIGRLLAEHLGVERCAYAEVEDEQIFVITGDYTRGVPSIVGRWPVASFGAECERLMLANEPYVMDDVDSDSRAGEDLTAYRATTIQSVICVPLHKAGRFVAAMAVHQTVPRKWTPAEIELVRTVVVQSWETIERTRVARGLKESAQRLALAFSAGRLGDWSWDAATDVVTLSARAAEIFGVGTGEPITWTQLQTRLHPEDRERARTAVERAISERSQYDVDYRIVTPEGRQTWASAKGLGHYRADGAVLGMYGVLQDVSDRKRLEQQLQERAEQLADADRRKDDFIALLAHELRNPLAPIRTGLQVMRLAAGDANAVSSAREMMDRQLTHMVRLVDDLLDVSRMGRNKLHLQKARLLLSEVISHAVEIAVPVLESAGHELTVTIPPEAVLLDADMTRLAQVFGNLLTNSAKYTAPGGRIWLTAQLQNESVVVAVRDNGIGIPADALPHVFDLFSQVGRNVERASGGLGIGLALVKGLVLAHGGTVTAESPGLGAGTTFTVCLPVAARKPEPVAEAVAEAPPQSPLRVLIADDNEDGAASMAELLALLGHEVQVARDGVEAVERAEQMRPDLVLMDIGMPRLDGLEATRKIRERPWSEAVTIVALTGWGQEDDREKSRAAGCNSHLVKPVSITRLQELLVRVFGDQRG